MTVIMPTKILENLLKSEDNETFYSDRGTGKSFGIAYKAIDFLLNNPRKNVLIVGKHKQIIKTLNKYIKEICYSLSLYYIENSNNVFSIGYQTIILKEYTCLTGHTADLILIDEAQEFNNSELNNIKRNTCWLATSSVPQFRCCKPLNDI